MEFRSDVYSTTELLSFLGCACNSTAKTTEQTLVTDAPSSPFPSVYSAFPKPKGYIPLNPCQQSLADPTLFSSSRISRLSRFMLVLPQRPRSSYSGMAVSSSTAVNVEQGDACPSKSPSDAESLSSASAILSCSPDANSQDSCNPSPVSPQDVEIQVKCLVLKLMIKP